MATSAARLHGNSLPVLHPFTFRRWRQRTLNLNQVEAAEALGLGIATLRKWESMGRSITAPGLISYACQALNYKLKPTPLNTILSSELRQRRLDRINEKAGTSESGNVISITERSKSNALPGVDMETGAVIVDPNLDHPVIDPDSFLKWRKQHRFTLKDIARLFVVSPTTPKKWSICERAMPSPRIVQLACAAIDAGLKPAFDDSDMTTTDEVERLHAEYLKVYETAEKKGGFALMRFYRINDPKYYEDDDGVEDDFADAFPPDMEFKAGGDVTPSQQMDRDHELEMAAVRNAVISETDLLQPQNSEGYDSYRSDLDLTFLSRKIAEAVNGLDLLDSEIAIKQILSAIPADALRASIRAHAKKKS
ncbi:MULTISPECIES: DNA-binding transcriptional regulator [unclassified Pannonibacter]|uniref:helix-turn-helix domain-containing protein n=1 Tax=unclassified Pannonibacter TaxID=2627228 RepID=UPI001647992D|nr:MULTISPECIES: helix-turn-helix transcriptional regulator [unclassified Pannonibacter]